MPITLKKLAPGELPGKTTHSEMFIIS